MWKLTAGPILQAGITPQLRNPILQLNFSPSRNPSPGLRESIAGVYLRLSEAEVQWDWLVSLKPENVFQRVLGYMVFAEDKPLNHAGDK